MQEENRLKRFLWGWALLCAGIFSGALSITLSFSKWAEFGFGTAVGGLVLSIGGFMLLAASFLAWETGKRALSFLSFVLWIFCVAYEFMGIMGYLRTAQHEIEKIAYAKSAGFSAMQQRVETAQQRVADLSAYATFDEARMETVENSWKQATGEFAKYCY